VLFVRETANSFLYSSLLLQFVSTLWFAVQFSSSLSISIWKMFAPPTGTGTFLQIQQKILFIKKSLKTFLFFSSFLFSYLLFFGYFFFSLMIFTNNFVIIAILFHTWFIIIIIIILLLSHLLICLIILLRNCFSLISVFLIYLRTFFLLILSHPCNIRSIISNISIFFSFRLSLWIAALRILNPLDDNRFFWFFLYISNYLLILWFL